MKRRGSTPRGEGPQPPQHHHHYLRFLQHGGEAAPQPAYAANGWNGHCQPRKRPGIHPRSWHWTAFAEARLPVFLERKARDFRAAAEEAEGLKSAARTGSTCQSWHPGSGALAPPGATRRPGCVGGTCPPARSSSGQRGASQPTAAKSKRLSRDERSVAASLASRPAVVAWPLGTGFEATLHRATHAQMPWGHQRLFTQEQRFEPRV